MSGKKGVKLSQQARTNIRNSKLGVKNPMYGKHPGELTRLRMRLVKLGHFITDETRRKIGQKHKDKEISPRTRSLLSEKLKAFWGNLPMEERQKRISRIQKTAREPTGNEKLRQTQLGKVHSGETRLKISRSNKGRIVSIVTRQRIRAALEIVWQNEDLRQSQAQKAYKNWQTPEYSRKVLQKRYARPNRKEALLGQLLDKVCPSEFDYVGNGSVCICGMQPDYISHSGGRKVIELYGDYWHRGQNPQERVDKYGKLGFNCLVIWEHELNNLAEVERRILTWTSAN